MGETRGKFGADFREGAIRLVRKTGKPIAQMARELGIDEGTFGKWFNADRHRRKGGEGQLSDDKRAELARLRKENAELAMECDVLKRSSYSASVSVLCLFAAGLGWLAATRRCEWLTGGPGW
jgi:transposase